MKVLVVGSSSSLGEFVVPKLRTYFDVVTAGRRNSDIFLDLLNIDHNFSLPSDISVLINMAADFGGDDIADFQRAEVVNNLALTQLLQASVKANLKHFVNISSTSALVSSSSPFFTAYALSKKHGDETALFICKGAGISCTILRPSQIYGTHSLLRNRPFLRHALHNASANKNINIFGSYDAKRSYIHVQDLYEIINQVITLTIPGCYLCTHEDDVSFAEVAQIAIEAHSSDSKVVFMPEHKNLYDNVFSYDRQFYEKIGFAPKISIRKGINALVAS